MKLVAPITPVIKVKLFPKPPASKMVRKIHEENMIAEVNQAINEWYYERF